SFEVAKAIEYMLTLRNNGDHRIIDPDKIAIMGHSFGGIVTIFSNASLNDHKAAISISAVSESWTAFDEEDGKGTPDDSDSIRLLKGAASDGIRPTYFLTPANDVNTRPVFVLSRAAAHEDFAFITPREVQAALFPAVPLNEGE